MWRLGIRLEPVLHDRKHHEGKLLVDRCLARIGLAETCGATTPCCAGPALPRPQTLPPKVTRRRDRWATIQKLPFVVLPAVPHRLLFDKPPQGYTLP